MTIKVNHNVYEVNIADEFDQLVKKLGLSTSAHTHVKEIKAPMCGIIFSLQQLNQVEAGDTLFSILETDSCHINRTTLDAYRELEKLKVTKIRM